jgi:hypothetical protein
VKQEGWVRKEFDPFLNDLEEKGFEIDPAILIRTFAAIGTGRARLKDIKEDFWEDQSKFWDAWEKTKDSVKEVVKLMNNIGILSSEILPSHNALIPLFVLHSKFGKDFNFKKALYWFLIATGDGRYSGSAITVLDQDIQNINSSPSFDEAINNLIKQLNIPETFTKDDFLKDFRDNYLRLVLYLIIFNNDAKDWIHQDIKIGYDRSENQLNEGFKPEWHHFFPKKLLKDRFDGSKINSLANIVVLNEKANRTFTSKEPKDYIKKYQVKLDRLKEQLIPLDSSLWEIKNYDKFLEERASALAEAANKLMKELKNIGNSGEEFIARTVIIPEEVEMEKSERKRKLISEEPGNYEDNELKEKLKKYLLRDRETPRRIREILIPLCLKHDRVTREMLKEELINRKEAEDEGKAGIIISTISREIRLKRRDYLRQVIQYDKVGTSRKENYRIEEKYKELVKNVLEELGKQKEKG